MAFFIINNFIGFFIILETYIELQLYNHGIIQDIRRVALDIIYFQ